jgi:hypothetical protein
MDYEKAGVMEYPPSDVTYGGQSGVLERQKNRLPGKA